MAFLRVINPAQPDQPEDRTDNEEEFVSELTAHQSSLRAFILSLMPGESDVDDVLQRTNLTLWRKRESFTLGTNFRAWAFEVAKWNVRSSFKDKKRKHWLVFDEELTSAVADQMLTQTQISTSDRQAAMRECLSKLREIDRHLLISHYEVGESLAEFAERTNRSRKGLKVALFRLRATLRRCIGSRLALQNPPPESP